MGIKPSHRKAKKSCANFELDATPSERHRSFWSFVRRVRNKNPANSVPPLKAKRMHGEFALSDAEKAAMLK